MPTTTTANSLPSSFHRLVSFSYAGDSSIPQRRPCFRSVLIFVAATKPTPLLQSPTTVMTIKSVDLRFFFFVFSIHLVFSLDLFALLKNVIFATEFAREKNFVANFSQFAREKFFLRKKGFFAREKEFPHKNIEFCEGKRIPSQKSWFLRGNPISLPKLKTFFGKILEEKRRSLWD